MWWYGVEEGKVSSIVLYLGLSHLVSVCLWTENFTRLHQFFFLLLQGDRLSRVGCCWAFPFSHVEDQNLLESDAPLPPGQLDSDTFSAGSDLINSLPLMIGLVMNRTLWHISRQFHFFPPPPMVNTWEGFFKIIVGTLLRLWR